MADGIWAATSGAVAQNNLLQAHANNLANLKTTAFKADTLVFVAAVAPDNGEPGLATSHHVGTLESVPDWSQGGILPSTSPLDMALDGAGFFALLTPSGERLTRVGKAAPDADGLLRSEGGHPFAGLAGAVMVPLGADLSVDGGGVVFADGQPIDRLKVVDVPDRSRLRREAGGLWDGTSASPFVIEPEIQAGALEASNVAATGVMTQLVVCQRAYESFHRCIETISGSERRLVERVS